MAEPVKAQKAVSDRIAGQTPPGRSLDAAYKYCDPWASLAAEDDAGIHADLSATRDGDPFVGIRRAIAFAGDDVTSLHLLSGHMGSGKTTELRRLSHDLGVSPLHPTVVYFDAEALLNLHVTDLPDILVGLWLVVAGDGPPPLANIVPLPGDVTARAAKLLTTWWRDRIRNQLVQLSAELPTALGDGLRAVLGQLKGAPADDPWRVAMRPVTQTLIEGLNAAIGDMRGHDGPPVVFVIDQLEKLAPGGHVDQLYGQRLVALKQLKAHVVLAVPLHLCYGAGGAKLIAGIYGTAPLVLPMVKVVARGAEREPHPPGIDAVARLLNLRVDFARLFVDGIAAAKSVASLSGGSIRHALQLTQGAIVKAAQPKVAAADIDRVAREMTAGYERALPDGWVNELVHVHRHNRFRGECAREVKGDLLYNLYVLEYQNGDPEPWHAVHPLVPATRKVQMVLAPTAS